METLTIVAVATLMALLFYFVRRRYSYWERKGIPFVPPKIPYGNFKDFGKIHQGALIQKFYNEMKGKGPFFGLYSFLLNPLAIATDLEFIKTVMIKEFHHFQDRGLYTNEKDDPLSGHLFSIGGPKWRQLRTKLTPTFTSGKMKFMYPTIVQVASEFQSTINDLLEKDGCADLEVKDLLARFTTDVIGQCAFGIECNSLKNPEAQFRAMGRKVFDADKGRILKFMIISNLPKLAKFFSLRITRQDVATFFLGSVKDTVEYREKNNVKRNDFMDLLLKLKNPKGVDETGKALEGLNLGELSAQAYVFFLAGFETSSTAMTFALYEIAINQEIQQKARAEIKEVLAKHNGEFTYEAMMDLSYIDQIIQESLRKYPPVTNLNRIVTKPFKVPDMDFTFELDTRVWIPVYALHHDPEYYPNPEIFDPDRFAPEEVRKRNVATYLPFGDGPRNCIGLRFGMMQARVGLYTLLSNFEISVGEKTIVPMEISKKNFVLSPEGGVTLNFRKIAAA